MNQAGREITRWRDWSTLTARYAVVLFVGATIGYVVSHLIDGETKDVLGWWARSTPYILVVPAAMLFAFWWVPWIVQDYRRSRRR